MYLFGWTSQGEHMPHHDPWSEIDAEGGDTEVY